jgi:transposase-like protein
MNLSYINEHYNTQAKCVAYLEKVRWHGKPICPHCKSDKITPRALIPKHPAGRKRIHEEQPRNVPLYHCNGCNKDFTVLMGTIFEGSKIPLQKWFLLITLMVNAKKGISAAQISRDLDITYKSAWFSAMRVRCAMLDQADMLNGIVEMDEAYIGGKPRHRNTPEDNSAANLSSLSTKSGRGTKQIPVVGIVERDGKKRVVTKILEGVSSEDLVKLLKRYVNINDAIVMTDGYPGYNAFDKLVQHFSVNHSAKEYVRDGFIHTNTIEGFWSLVKNGIRGQYHVLSKKYLPFYLAEFSYKYNHRNEHDTTFEETIENAVTDKKEMVNYKPTAYPKFLAYKRKKKKTVAGKKD